MCIGVDVDMIMCLGVSMEVGVCKCTYVCV